MVILRVKVVDMTSTMRARYLREVAAATIWLPLDVLTREIVNFRMAITTNPMLESTALISKGDAVGSITTYAGNTDFFYVAAIQAARRGTRVWTLPGRVGDRPSRRRERGGGESGTEGQGTERDGQAGPA
jgi:hypothetical protein